MIFFYSLQDFDAREENYHDRMPDVNKGRGKKLIFQNRNGKDHGISYNNFIKISLWQKSK